MEWGYRVVTAGLARVADYRIYNLLKLKMRQQFGRWPLCLALRSRLRLLSREKYDSRETNDVRSLAIEQRTPDGQTPCDNLASTRQLSIKILISCASTLLLHSSHSNHKTISLTLYHHLSHKMRFTVFIALTATFAGLTYAACIASSGSSVSVESLVKQSFTHG